MTNGDLKEKEKKRGEGGGWSGESLGRDGKMWRGERDGRMWK